ncbi:uncharacterized protein DDB_G0271670-like [Uranotaenia lowii]|uniref:uncharacterized protein DDB_G0271670-like n=1 Tax=Uranotaenia lowii TaxID=190385 RepID=UPI0024784724|nr:uncharacterized protein DDB_G0271670-like [Uranotaenia lowii]
MSINRENDNISPGGPMVSQHPSRSAATHAINGGHPPMAKRPPLKLSIPTAKHQFPVDTFSQPSTAPVHSMSKPFGINNGVKFNRTPEFGGPGTSPLANSGNGMRFGSLSKRLGEFEEIEDGFVTLGGSPLMASGFDSNGSLQIGSLTASPDHSPMIVQLMDSASVGSPGTGSSQGTGSTSSLTRLMRLSPAQLHGCYQQQHPFEEMSDLADSSGSAATPSAIGGSPTPPARGGIGHSLFGAAGGGSNASSSSSLATGGGASSALGVSGSSSAMAATNSSSSSSTAQELINSSKSSRVSSSSSSTSTSRMAKTSSTQRLMSSSLTSSSSSSTTSSSAAAIKQGLDEMQSSMAEMKNMMSHSSASQMSTSSSSTMSSTASSSQLKKMGLTSNNSSNLTELQKRLRSSMDSLDEPMTEYQVTHPDSDGEIGSLVSMAPNGIAQQNGHALMNGADTVKFEQKQMTSESKRKVVTDGFSSEQATLNSAQSKSLQAGDVQYQEEAALAAMSNKMEIDGLKTEEKGALLKVSLGL